MAEATGIPLTTIASIERDPDAAPRADTLRQAAAGLGCTVDELVALGTSPIPPALLTLVEQGGASPPPTAVELEQLARARVVLGREPRAQDYLVLLMLIRSA